MGSPRSPSGWWRIAFVLASQRRPTHCVNKQKIFHIPLLSELKSSKTVRKACHRKINLSPLPEMLKNTDEIKTRPRSTSAPVHPFFIAEVESSFTADLSQRGG